MRDGPGFGAVATRPGCRAGAGPAAAVLRVPPRRQPRQPRVASDSAVTVMERTGRNSLTVPVAGPVASAARPAQRLVRPRPPARRLHWQLAAEPGEAAAAACAFDLLLGNRAPRPGPPGGRPNPVIGQNQTAAADGNLNLKSRFAPFPAQHRDGEF